MTITSYGQATFHYPKPDNLVDLFEGSVARFGGNPLVGTKDAAGTYQWTSYREVGARVDAARAGLAALGVGRGDAVGIIANNRLEWIVGVFATYGLGARWVPMYEAELEQTWRYILKDATVKVVLVATPAIADKIRAFQPDIPTLQHVITIPGTGPGTLADLEARGKAAPLPSIKPGPDDVASLIYTSGTTGDPKGVLLTHGNFTTNVAAGRERFPHLDDKMVSLSILPWAHSFGVTAELYMGVSLGASTGIPTSAQTIIEDIQVVRPTFLIAVPRVFNRIYAGIQQRMEKEGGLKKKLFDLAVAVAKKRRQMHDAGKPCPGLALPHLLLDKVVFAKVRERFGGRLKESITGSAAMNPEIGAFFRDLGIGCYDCYGLSETTPAVTINCPTAHRSGSVGRPIEQCRVVIDTSLGDPNTGDGEIIVYGPNVMKGYHNKPEATAAVMTPDGGFRTGDRGRLDDDGYLFITGRIKEQYKLENGKYVFPAAIEEEIKLLPWVLNVMIHGDGKPYNVALVVVDPEAFRQQVEGAQGLPADPAAFAASSEAAALVQETLAAHLKGTFGGYEIPRRVLLLPEDFSLDNGMLTQTMKLKRREVIKRFGERIEGAYRG